MIPLFRLDVPCLLCFRSSQIGTAATNLLIAARKAMHPSTSSLPLLPAGSGGSSSKAGTGTGSSLEAVVTEAVAVAAAEETEKEAEVPILATSLAYGVYMAVSSNLR